MNHRLKLRWDEIRGLHLTGVWCPADHGGECDTPEVAVGHEVDCAIYATATPVDCNCGRIISTGRCWAKENLDEVAAATGWDDVLVGGIDLPWVAVTIEGPGPEGNDALVVRVVAEVELRETPE